jgi:hypothetical protein
MLLCRGTLLPANDEARRNAGKGAARLSIPNDEISPNFEMTNRSSDFVIPSSFSTSSFVILQQMGLPGKTEETTPPGMLRAQTAPSFDLHSGD